jgi:membrane protein implicated in regulation of membrane protease activity
MVCREIVLEKPLGRKGSLNIEGELWKVELQAYTGVDVPAGERVKVVNVTGLTVLVARV